MSVKGRRIIKDINEETLLGDIKGILEEAKNKGFIKGYEIDIEAIVKNKGLKIVREDLPSSISGYLKHDENSWLIGVNKNHSLNRQRFTIAHEFAHYCLHRREGSYFEDTTFFRREKDTSLEYKANEFAAEILMPEELMRDAMSKGVKKIIELSNRFSISVQAIKFRGMELGYHIKSN